ncbi:molybdate ABC transporter substrate-binding protein [Pontixanthobacter sp.]|uniref:molybdate ABC transporter substrate-binding protein n=1 Tax=Pontixanthobacter sp. TaxID=2792078 RepID=UPI003C79A36C
MFHSIVTLFRLTALLAGLFSLTACMASEPRGPLVLAASSLQRPLEDLAERWRAQGHLAPQFSFASSAALARQIESGSPADIFISADQEWTDYLATAGRISDTAIYPVAGNTLVIASAADAAVPTLQELSALEQIVTGDSQSVPLGRYARQALTSAGVWNTVEPKIVGASSARGALVIMARGEADAGILYASDAQDVKQIASAPIDPALYSPIRYMALQLPASAHPDTAEFLAFIASAEGAQVFDRYGFTRP